MVASLTPPTGDLTCNPGMCPDWESNWRALDSEVRAQSIEPHQPGLILKVLKGTVEEGVHLKEVHTWEKGAGQSKCRGPEAGEYGRQGSPSVRSAVRDAGARSGDGESHRR